MKYSALAAAFVYFLALNSISVSAELSAERTEQGVAVKIDGKLFTEYLTKSHNKPALWPIIGPTGQEMTRAYPLDKTRKGEKTDHVHHRSLWFTHGAVNGVDFWAEGAKSGSIVHRKFAKVEGGKQATIVAENDWIGPDGKKVCEDERTLVFGVGDDQRWIDFQVVVTASEGKLTFGDTKEGSFAVRVPHSMAVDTKLGGKIVNSEGQTDGATWGKPAAWVDYFGPVAGKDAGGETLGIAILNHPSSFRYPTTWHVRTYGLFAANPFGQSDFTNMKDKDGSHTLNRGETLTLRHRVIFHQGDHTSAKIAEAFKEYSK